MGLEGPSHWGSNDGAELGGMRGMKSALEAKTSERAGPRSACYTFLLNGGNLLLDPLRSLGSHGCPQLNQESIHAGHACGDKDRMQQSVTRSSFFFQ